MTVYNKLFLLCTCFVYGVRSACLYTDLKIDESDLYNKTVVQVSSPSVPMDKFGKSFYYYGITLQGNFFQAIEFCNNLKMSVLSIESKEENDFIYSSIEKNLGKDNYNFWTSGTSLPSSGTHWHWMSTGQGVSFTQWDKNQPDHRGTKSVLTEQCIEVFYTKSKPTLYWNDLECSTPRYVICEVEAAQLLSQLIGSGKNNCGSANCNLTAPKPPSSSGPEGEAMKAQAPPKGADV